VKYTRLQIVRILKERGWTKSGTFWFAKSGYHKTVGVDLRAAASLEALESKENLDTRRRK
jgi:hypothetical protein